MRGVFLPNFEILRIRALHIVETTGMSLSFESWWPGSNSGGPKQQNPNYILKCFSYDFWWPIWASKIQ